MILRQETERWTIDYSGEKPATPLLDTVNYPVEMKNLSTEVHSHHLLAATSSCHLIFLLIQMEKLSSLVYFFNG